MLLDESILGSLPALRAGSFTSPVPPPGIIGYDTIGSNSDTFDGSQYLCVRFTALANGSFNTIRIRTFSPFHPGPEPMTAAVMSAAPTMPDALLALGTGTYANTPDWYDFPVSYSYSAGEELYLVMWGSVHFTVFWDPGAVGQTARKFSFAYNSIQNPNTTLNQVLEDRVYSIYAL